MKLHYQAPWHAKYAIAARPFAGATWLCTTNKPVEDFQELYIAGDIELVHAVTADRTYSILLAIPRKEKAPPKECLRRSRWLSRSV